FILFYSMSKYAVIPTKVGTHDAGPKNPFYPVSSRTDPRLGGNDGLEVARNSKKNRNRTRRIPA
ncbi:hypothetical protein ACEY2D_011565, partial [Neisseria gonorrhoeae]